MDAPPDNAYLKEDHSDETHKRKKTYGKAYHYVNLHVDTPHWAPRRKVRAPGVDATARVFGMHVKSLICVAQFTRGDQKVREVKVGVKEQCLLFRAVRDGS